MRKAKRTTKFLQIGRLFVAAAILTNVSCQLPNQLTDSLNRPDLAELAFNSINHQRELEHLPPLRWDNAIKALAEEHSLNMAEGTVSFGHEGFLERVERLRSSITLVAAGENVGYVNGQANPVGVIVGGWLEKSEHRANILGHFHLSGIGAAQGPGGEILITQIFVETAQ